MASNAGFRPQELQRRKFQEVAAVAIDKQAQAIQQTREVMADLAARLDGFEVVRNELKMLREHYIDFRRDFHPMTFWQRLRWLFTGR